MSFDYNPFKHFEIIKVQLVDPDDELNNEQPKSYAWYCHSCGRESHTQGIAFGMGAAISTIEASYRQHLRTSHRMEPQDVEDWPRL